MRACVHMAIFFPSAFSFPRSFACNVMDGGMTTTTMIRRRIIVGGDDEDNDGNDDDDGMVVVIMIGMMMRIMMGMMMMMMMVVVVVGGGDGDGDNEKGGCLFNIIEDPGEHHEVSAQHPGKIVMCSCMYVCMMYI